MLDKYMLTVSIPTYNRPVYLENCLDALLKSAANLSALALRDICVKVFDNSENDASKVIAENKKYFPLNLSYVKNGVNIGSDNNIMQSILCFDSEYVAVMGDDDYVNQNYFPHVLSLIETNKFDLVFLKSYGLTTSKDLIRPLQLPILRYFDNPRDILMDRLIQVGFISTIIYRRSLINDDQVRRSYGSNLIQVAACFSVMDKMKYAVYSGLNIVGVTRNNSGGYSPVDIFYCKFFDLLSLHNNFGMSESQLSSFKNRMLFVFYSRSFAQYMRVNKMPLSKIEMSNLDSAFKGSIVYKYFFRRLFLKSSKFTFNILSVTFIASNLVLYPSRMLDFLAHAINYSYILMRRIIGR